MLSRIEWERSEFSTLRTQMEELFDSFFGDLTSRYFIPAVGTFADGQVFENDREFVLVIALPDMDKDDIEVTVQGNNLTVKTQQAEDYEKDSEGTAHRKRRKRTSIRTVRLPNDLQTDRIEASFVEGMLKITLPKQERTLQRVKVKT